MAQVTIVVIYSPEDTSARDVLVAALRRAGADVWYEEVSRAKDQLKDQALAAFRREARQRGASIRADAAPDGLDP